MGRERIVRDRGIQDVGPVANVMRPDRVVDVHDRGFRIHREDRALHRADVLARSEVGGQRDDRGQSLRPPQLRRRRPSLIRASSFFRRRISESAFAARASRSLSFASRVLSADCAACTATRSAASASRSPASFARRSSIPARWAAIDSCRRFASASARPTRFSASDSRSSTSSTRCWRLSSFSRRAASCVSTSRSRVSIRASRRWISCFDRDSRVETVSDRFSSFLVSCACDVSDFSSAALRDSMSCRSERNAVSCSSKVAFNDSFDSDSFASARSAAATSLSRRSSSPRLAAYSSSSAARRDRRSPSTTSVASDRSAARSSAAKAVFARFAILLGDLAVLRREVLREFLHALRRLFELLPLVVEGRVLGLERFGLFGDFRAFLGEFRLAGLQVGRSSRERFLPFIERLFPLRHRADVVPQLQLPFPDCLLLGGEDLLAAFGFSQAVVEDLPGLGDLLGLPLQIAVQIVHLFALAFEGRGPRVERGLAVPVGGFLRRELALQPPEFGLPFREAAPLGLQIGAGLLGFHREDLLLGLDLHVPGRPSLFEAAQDQPARLLDRLQFGPEGVQFPLSHRAPLAPLFEFPLPAVQLLFALDERLFLIATAL